MFVQIPCAFCEQSFDYDCSSGETLAACPHCGKQNSVSAPTGAGKNLTLQHGAPNLSGAKRCPSCQAQIARDAVLCVHCGYNFSTGRKIGKASGSAANKNRVLLLGGGLIVLLLALAYLLWPEPETPPPPFMPATEPAAEQPAPPPEPPVAAVDAPAPPPPPPGPTPEERVAQQAAAERVEFEAKKFEAEQNLRLQLDTREPLYKTNEALELRRKNGLVDKGTLTGFSGTGTNRVVLVATPTGEIGIPLVALDLPSRRRLDPEFREAFIQHMMTSRRTATPGEPSAK